MKTINLDQLLADKEITLWKKEILQEQIVDKLNTANRKIEISDEQAVGYIKVIELTETMCSNTPCGECGLDYLLTFLESEK